LVRWVTLELRALDRDESGQRLDQRVVAPGAEREVGEDRDVVERGAQREDVTVVAERAEDRLKARVLRLGDGQRDAREIGVLLARRCRIDERLRGRRRPRRETSRDRARVDDGGARRERRRRVVA